MVGKNKGGKTRDKGSAESGPKGATKTFEICFYFITLHAGHGASGAPGT